MIFQKEFHPNVNSNLESTDLKEKALPLSQLDLSKVVAIRILFLNFLKNTKNAFTQNAIDAFWFFASILSFLIISKLFCFVKVALIEQAQKIYLSKMIVQGKKCPGNLKNGQSMEIYRFVRNVYKYVLWRRKQNIN